jgi:hypothetical protein
MAGSCEHGSEPSGSIKGGELLDQLSVLSVPQKGLYSMEFTSESSKTDEHTLLVKRSVIEHNTTVDVDPFFWVMDRLDVGCTPDVSETITISIFRNM